MTPIPFQWDGEVMRPRPGFQKRCDASFVIGETYSLVIEEARSIATHNHEFAWLAEAWRNLPEALVDQFPTAEHLRKKALVDAGFYDEMIVDAGTNAAALRVASAFRSLDDFAHVVVRGPLVVRRTAKSQSRRAMDKAEFQRSKSAVMDVVAGLIGVPSAILAANAGAAA